MVAAIQIWWVEQGDMAAGDRAKIAAVNTMSSSWKGRSVDKASIADCHEYSAL